MTLAHTAHSTPPAATAPPALPASLRALTKPERWATNTTWLPAVGTASACLLWASNVYLASAHSHLGLLVCNLAIYGAARGVETRMSDKRPMLGTPRHVSRWAIPAAFIPAVALSSLSMTAAVAVIVVVAVASVIWDWSPWLVRAAQDGQAAAGWNTGLNNRTPFAQLTSSDTKGLTRAHNPQQWEEYSVELADQLDTLSGQWETTGPRVYADALAVGPGGVVGVFSADLDGVEVRHADVDADEDTIAAAQTALREVTGLPVYGSVAWNAKYDSENPDHSPHLLEQVNMHIVQNASQQASEFVDGQGNDLGFYIPAAAPKAMAYLASLVGMPAGQHPVAIVVAHGAFMDKPWGRVHVRDAAGVWSGTVIVCHPRYVADCIQSLPGAFASPQQVAGAQTAIELRTR